MLVSFFAMIFEIIPVLLTAVLSAFIWNYFFIQPIYTFHIERGEDILLFFMYFVVAFINSILTYRIKKAEKRVRDKEEKEKIIKLYNTMLNSLSHELRTPIATIISSVDLLKNNDKISEEGRMDLLEEVDMASIRLNQQVENLLNMSRLESGILKLKKDWTDIKELMYTIKAKTNFTDRERIVILDNINELPYYKLDVILMEQIITNLINNALIHTHVDSSIQIEILENENGLEIEIEDNGSGFPEEEIPFVFDKFYKLKQSSKGGVGLGLSIVKGFIEAMNGQIKLENKANSGSKFTIFIPCELSFINNLKNE
jgi:two-component system sensor histidine kinase KdpD